MNELSWLIYLADVTGTAKGFGIATVVASVGLSGLMGIVGALMLGEAYGCDQEKGRALKVMGAWKKLWPIALCGALVVIVFPSTQTLYAIAASEMGERVITSQTGGKAVKALEAWLDRQIAPKPEE